MVTVIWRVVIVATMLLQWFCIGHLISEIRACQAAELQSIETTEVLLRAVADLTEGRMAQVDWAISQHGGE